MSLNPKIKSKTYILKRIQPTKLFFLKKAWIGFLMFTIALAPVSGVVLSIFNSKAQAAEAVYDWAAGFGGSGYDESYWVDVDADGNVYTVGRFAGTADFDPGVGTANLVSYGGVDTFVSKLDANGNFVWVKQIGGAGVDTGKVIALDELGNFYLTGTFTGTADFDPSGGTTNLVSAGSYEVFIAKYDVDGGLVWANRLGGTGSDSSSGMVETDNGVYITGSFSGTADFDPGVGVANLVSAGGSDSYIVQLDIDGNYIMSKQFGGVGNEAGNGIAIGQTDEIYTVGGFSGTVDFDPGVGVANLVSAGSNDIYISKLDQSGDYVWADRVGGSGYDSVFGVAIDQTNHVSYIASFSGTIDFDPGVGVSNLTSSGGDEIGISRLDSGGNFVWAKQLGGTGYDYGYGIFTDTDGNVFTAGSFDGTADFDPGVGTYNITVVGGFDAFLSKLDSSGNFVWAKSFGGLDYEYGYNGLATTSDNLYLTGYYDATVDFDPGAGTRNITSAGGGDAFVVKLQPLTTPTVSTGVASEVTRQTATLTGEVTDLGGADVTDRGFEYGVDLSYGETVEESAGPYAVGEFSASVTGLTCGTMYHFRAFATNSEGVSNGVDNTFATSNCPSTSTSGSSPRGDQNSGSDSLQFPTSYIAPSSPVMNPDGTLNSNSGVANPKSPTGTNLIPSSQMFLRNLGYGMVGEDVKRLQQFLNTNGYDLSNTGAGSIGNETTYYGSKTHRAVKIFQETFAPAILAPLGLTVGTGYFGEHTRKFVNGLLN